MNQSLCHGQAESARLAGAGLGKPDNIEALEGLGDDLVLDGCGVFEADGGHEISPRARSSPVPQTTHPSWTDLEVRLL